MSLGSSPAGVGPTGYDPLVAADAPTVPQAFRAAFFDPFVGDYTLDGDGRVQDVHPVDQKVALRLSIRRGSLGGLSDFGHRLFLIKRLQTRNTVAQVNDAVKVALADLVAAGEVSITQIRVDYNSRGQLNVLVAYHNLILDAARSAPVVI